MKLEYNQSLQLQQTLKLNQIMVQRFNVLQQTVTELKDTIQEKVKENPFLRVRFMDRQNSVPSLISDDSYVSPLDFATYDESLMSVLTNQLENQYLSDRDYQIVLTLIDYCDERGFISNYKDVRSEIVEQFSVSDRDVFRCLKILQSFEPEGIGARSVNECLWIQVNNYDLDDETDRENLKQLTKLFLDDIATKNYEKICAALDISFDQLETYMEFIKHLNPSPGYKYSTNAVNSVEPSLRIEVIDGEIKLTNLEEERIALTLDSDMVAKLKSDGSSDLAKQFQDAKIWLEHFNKRQNLIKYCGELLIQRQRLYFLKGNAFILPCLQKDMAASLGVSASTISRLARSKYIECDHGLILIRSLCQRSIYGKTASQVRSLVEYYCQEYPNFSDQKISNCLKEIGLPIARRTVTKYRHEVNVQSSYDRKK